MKTKRVERHIINQSNKYYSMLDDYCFKSKNLYNFANYHVRQRFIKSSEWLRYNEMDKLLKQENMDFDYRNMPSAQSSQQCLRLLEKNWKAFFKAIKDYSKHKEKYLGRPKLPKYLKKNGRNVLILTNFNCKLKDGYIEFPKTFKGFTIKTNVTNLQQVRIVPKNKQYIIEVIYNIEVPTTKENNQKYVGVDIGLDNLATLTNNCSYKFKIINGKKLKSINKYYNKKLSYYRELAKKLNNLDWTNRMNQLTIKRNNLIDDLIHKASRSIIKYTLNCGANTIVIGNNKNWKQNSSMSKKVNQSFVGISHQKLIEQIQYKAENVGIKVIPTEESYTSGTSFLDSELPTKEFYNKSRRVHRGLFKSNSGKLINADVNGSLQIIRKVFSDAFNSHEIEDYGFNPIVVNL